MQYINIRKLYSTKLQEIIDDINISSYSIQTLQENIRTVTDIQEKYRLKSKLIRNREDLIELNRKMHDKIDIIF